MVYTPQRSVNYDCVLAFLCVSVDPHSDITRILELYVQAEMNELQEILEQNLMFASVHKAKTGIYKEKPSGGTHRIKAFQPRKEEIVSSSRHFSFITRL